MSGTPTNDLNELMSRDPTDLSTQDIDKIIAYHRQQRARRAAGEKIEKPKVDLSGILNKIQITKPKPEVKITRRI